VAYRGDQLDEDEPCQVGGGDQGLKVLKEMNDLILKVAPSQWVSAFFIYAERLRSSSVFFTRYS
jgi:hypothetical protein